jgi:hypothetical protein
VRARTRCWLENTQGLVEVEEGEKLAELASQVTAKHAIAEVGSHTGRAWCPVGLPQEAATGTARTSLASILGASRSGHSVTEREKRMPDRGLWISGVILIAWILTTIGLIAFGVFTRLPRGDHRVSR